MTQGDCLKRRKNLPAKYAKDAKINSDIEVGPDLRRKLIASRSDPIFCLFVFTSFRMGRCRPEGRENDRNWNPFSGKASLSARSWGKPRSHKTPSITKRSFYRLGFVNFESSIATFCFTSVRIVISSNWGKTLRVLKAIFTPSTVR